MLVYKDMTFCGFTECGKTKSCHRVLTTAIIRRSKKVGLPISQFGSKPECFIDRKKMCLECCEKEGTVWDEDASCFLCDECLAMLNGVANYEEETD